MPLASRYEPDSKVLPSKRLLLRPGGFEKADTTNPVNNTGSCGHLYKPERKTETIIRPVTEGEANTNLAVHISTVTSGSATSVVVITTVKNDSPNDSVPFLYGLDFMVVASVGIIAVTAAVTAITISIVCIRKGRRDDRHRRSNEAPLPLEDLLPEHQNPNEDETKLPRPCLWPALPGDYLHPAVSCGIKEGTDDAKNVTPLYENSTLRNNSRPELADVLSPVTHLPDDASHSKSSDIAVTCSSACSAETTRHHDDGMEAADETEELESGYMPMTGTLRSIPPVAASQASREVAAAARISIPLYENNSAVSE
ncbi:hypothetical protein BaRGS_00018478 [Batillaria attramentaria]|uniref:Uncharacterized protein n=1 Tax=Batillaria attramentaria TaxID=370345 RepID=A0ABD0KU55_9CAEN